MSSAIAVATRARAAIDPRAFPELYGLLEHLEESEGSLSYLSKDA